MCTVTSRNVLKQVKANLDLRVLNNGLLLV